MQYQTINPLWAEWFPPIPTFPTLGCRCCQGGQQIISDNDTINIGSGSIGGNPSPVTVTIVTTPTYTALATDYFLCVNTSTTAVTITLPTGILGTVYIIKDCAGNADVNNITIVGTGGQLVDGSSGAIINTPYGGIQLIFNGVEWSIV